MHAPALFIFNQSHLVGFINNLPAMKDIKGIGMLMILQWKIGESNQIGGAKIGSVCGLTILDDRVSFGG